MDVMFVSGLFFRITVHKTQVPSSVIFGQHREPSRMGYQKLPNLASLELMSKPR